MRCRWAKGLPGQAQAGIFRPLFWRSNGAFMIELDFKKGADGLLPVVAQDYQTGEVLNALDLQAKRNGSA